LTPVRILLDIELVPASVPRTATFLQAAEALVSHPVTTIAVVGGDNRVAGLFGDADLLGGIFPGYLGELRHTAFASDDVIVLRDRARAVAAEPVEKHMRRPVTLDADASAIHAAERFLHCDFGALPVVRDESFVGMLGRAELCRAMLRRWDEESARPRARP
jgi:CBS domain-containing protein